MLCSDIWINSYLVWCWIFCGCMQMLLWFCLPWLCKYTVTDLLVWFWWSLILNLQIIFSNIYSILFEIRKLGVLNVYKIPYITVLCCWCWKGQQTSSRRLAGLHFLLIFYCFHRLLSCFSLLLCNFCSSAVLKCWRRLPHHSILPVTCCLDY